MRYKQFVDWCNCRAADGCWGINEAIICIDVMKTVDTFPFFIRDKVWHTYHEDYILQNIVTPIDEKISKLLKGGE